MGDSFVYSVVRPGDKVKDYNIVYKGDPIFVVDMELGIIKAYVVKAISQRNNGLQIKCCEKGKNQDLKPDVNFVYTDKKIDGYLSFTVPIDKSSYGLVSTTIEGAIKILSLYKNKGNFASLSAGDKIYAVNRDNYEIKELTVVKIENLNRLYEAYIIKCADGTDIVLSHKFYDDRASSYSDNAFSYHQKSGNWTHVSSKFVFVNKKSAESFIKLKTNDDKKKDVQPKDGTSTNLTDNNGTPIKIGDTVAYVNGTGSTIKISTAKVINNTKCSIKIFDKRERQSYIDYLKAINKTRIDRGLEPYDVNNCGSAGYKLIATNKVLVIKT